MGKKMKIYVPLDRIKARVYSTPEELMVVKEILSYKERVFRGRKRIRVHGGDLRHIQSWETVKRSALTGNFFLAGLLPRVKRGLETKGIVPEVFFETPRRIPFRKPSLHGIGLRDYQLDVIKKIIQKRRGLIVFPTGSGKTVMMAAVINTYKSLNFLVVVQKLDLLKQTINKFESMLGEEIGCLSGSQERWCPITVCTIQTLDSRGYATPFVGGLIVDEVHHAGSPSYRRVLGKIGSEIRIGFTATEAYIPRKQLQIEGLFGPVIASMPYEELADDGLLAAGTVLMYEIPVDTQVYTMSGSDWNNLYEAGIVNNMARNARIAILSHELLLQGKKVLIIVNRVSHGHLLCSMMGSEACFVYGGTQTQDRDKVVEFLNQSGGKVVIATSIFDEGMDFPSLDVVILARGWESPIATLQSAGRGTRISKGKYAFTVIDFYDRCHKALKRHSNSRIKAYRSKGWNVIMKKDINQTGVYFDGQPL
jgi:superfamily II DNA or RNA helicase